MNPRHHEIVERLLTRIAARDADAIAELFADRVAWFVPGDPKLPWTGRRTLRSEVAEYFRVLWAHVVPEKSITALEKIVVAGDDAVVFATFTQTAITTGREFLTPVALHIEVQAGKIVSLQLYEDTWAVREAFL